MTTSTRSVLFLDTNALHFCRLFLDTAKRNGLSDSGMSPEDVDRELTRLSAGRYRTAEDLIKGRKIVAYLRAASENDAQVEYAPLTCLEMMSGLLRGRAIQAAAQDQIPHRMWGHFSEREVLNRLSDEAYIAVERVTDGIDDQFQDAGVNLIETDPGSLPDVWRLARVVMRTVFFEPADCLVYTSAVLAQADNLVTADGYLRETASGIANPGAAQRELVDYFTAARSKIVTAAATVTSMDERLIVIPKAEKQW